MVSVNLVVEKEGLEQKVWIDSSDDLWVPNGGKKETLILNTKDPAWRGMYKIEKVEIVLNQKEEAQPPPYIRGGIVSDMEVKMYLKRK